MPMKSIRELSICKTIIKIALIIIIFNLVACTSEQTNMYTYYWKTDGTWKGTCRALAIKLYDGSEHRVCFQFK